ncbi:NAD(P)/FAD-dependent oxidoreductase [Falsiroseomonas stagni]|uniref:Glycine/D-amino acid oxidase n=1 Tax=Falsiroseomonas stagni DSM 19981 TaxID=1123062 RepID=A0A1I4DU52_9PROT|nr:FAD-binding oxidoreductase [Falsiroseomonas stagni]SFK96583.1 Glycine/D-amino acid oxidase [Falsiroseomonas stagni DSM 19981]
MIQQADVAIIGGGIVGLCLARNLAIAGRDVLLLDDGRHGGTNANAGSLHVQMQSRFLRMYPELVPNLEASLPLYPAAARRWSSLAEELGADVELRQSGGLMVCEDATSYEFLARKCAREEELGLRVEMLDRAAVRRIAPYLGDAVVGAELCHDEGKLNPLLANRALWDDLRQRGVPHRLKVWVERIQRDGAAMALTLSDGSALRAGTVVLAAGAGTGRLAAQLGAHVPTVAEPLHMNITEAAAPLVKHLVQHAERMITLKQLASGQVVIGGGWPARFAGPDQAPTVRMESLVGNLTLAQHIVPSVRDLRLLRTWAGVNTTTDGQCVLGPLAAAPRVHVAVPGDAGYTLGPLVADMAAAILLGRDPGFDVARFTPDRFSPAASG